MAVILLLASCSGEKKFDENLQDAYGKMIDELAMSTMVCSKTASTWRNAIYDNKTPSGKYCSDFNDALKELFQTYKKSGITDSISSYKTKLQEATSKLNDPPSSRKDCYNDFVDLVGDVSSLARMGTDPSGSLSSFNSGVNNTTESISRKIDQFKIKYLELFKDGLPEVSSVSLKWMVKFPILFI